MANFEFLSQADVEMDEDDEICDELDDSQDMDEQDEMRISKRKPRPKVQQFFMYLIHKAQWTVILPENYIVRYCDLST